MCKPQTSPTLCDLTGPPTPKFVHGQSLLPMLENPKAQGHPEIVEQLKKLLDQRLAMQEED